MKNRPYHWVVTLLILSSALIYLYGCGCGWFNPKFEPNPDLLFLTGDQSRPKGDYINPVWSPGGETIYYLHSTSGPLRAIDSNGSDDRKVLEGRFGAIAISPSGSKLALSADAAVDEGGILILVDKDGANEETLATTCPYVLDVEFSAESDSILYYYAYGEGPGKDGFYVMQIGAAEDSLLLAESSHPYGFDLSPGDSILFYSRKAYSLNNGSMHSYESAGWWPQFHPEDSEVLVFATHMGLGAPYTDFIWLFNLSTGKREELNTKTYEYSSAMFPYWSPDGCKIVFSSTEFQTGGLLDPVGYDLWILKDVSQ